MRRLTIWIMCRFNILRRLCQKEYGDDFVEMYDMINQGIPIGSIEETIIFIGMVERIKKMYYTKGCFNPIKYLINKNKEELKLFKK